MPGLSNVDMERRFEEKEDARRLIIEPLRREQIGPGSIDLTLGYEIGIPKRGSYPYIDPRGRNSAEGSIELRALKEDEAFWLQSKEVVLWLSKEIVKMPYDLKGFIYPRSSWMQLFINTTGFVDAGFEGKLVIEVLNLNEKPVVLRVGDRICQIVFVEDKTPSSKPYSGKYKGREHLESSKIWQDYL